MSNSNPDSNVNIILFNLDFYMNSFSLLDKGFNYYWKDLDEFKADTGWPFTEAMLVFYEPERNIYHIEYKGGRVDTGLDLPEIAWITENFVRMKEVAAIKKAQNVPVFLYQYERPAMLWQTDWLVTRHQEQVSLGITTSLSEAEFTELLNYRQALRDLGSQGYNEQTRASDVIWPTRPSFLPAQ